MMERTTDDLPQSVEELIETQKDLKEEEESLGRAVFKIEKQIHALQIERMHLLNMMNNIPTKALDIPTPTSSADESKVDVENKKLQDPNDSNLKVNLDLKIPATYKYYDEEEEESDEDEDEDYDDYL